MRLLTREQRKEVEKSTEYFYNEMVYREMAIANERLRNYEKKSNNKSKGYKAKKSTEDEKEINRAKINIELKKRRLPRRQW